LSIEGKSVESEEKIDEGGYINNNFIQENGRTSLLDENNKKIIKSIDSTP